MRRRTFDALVSAAGLLLVAVLVVAGVLLAWGHSYASNQVASQLSAQKIVFPATSNPEFTILPAANRAQMARYAGQHLALAGQAETVFKGTTLRSMLLEACGFWQLGQIALIASIASCTAAALMLILSVAGFVHLRRTAPEAEILPAIATRVQVNAT